MPETAIDFAIRRFQCRHVFIDGHRCGSPCLRGEDFCYYHHGTRRPRRATPASPTGLLHDPYNEPPNQTTLTLPIPEDHSSVQLAIGTIMQGLATNALDPRRAGLLLYALQIASGNLAGAPHHAADQIVEDITLDPAGSPLAPASELPEDILQREALQNLQNLEDLDEEDWEDEDDDEDEKIDEDED